jgi:hypothetical protein
MCVCVCVSPQFIYPFLNWDYASWAPAFYPALLTLASISFLVVWALSLARDSAAVRCGGSAAARRDARDRERAADDADADVLSTGPRTIGTLSTPVMIVPTSSARNPFRLLSLTSSPWCCAVPAVAYDERSLD